MELRLTADEFFRSERGRRSLMELGRYFDRQLHGNAEEARELLGDLREIAVRHWGQMDPEKGRYEAYLQGVAKKLVLRHRSRLFRVQRLLGLYPRSFFATHDVAPDTGEPLAPDPHAELERRQEARIFQEVVSELPPEQRRLIEMKSQGMTGEQMSQELGISHENVRVRLMRLMTKVREQVSTRMGASR